MSIIILILKIIGIVLLLLLALIIFLGLLALFVPARYKITADYNKDKKEALIKITWLFKIVSFCAFYKGEGIETKLTILGIGLKGRKKDKTNKNEDDEKEQIEQADRIDEAGKTAQDKPGQGEEVLEEQSENIEGLLSDKESDSGKGPFEKIADKLKGIVEKIKAIIEKIRTTIQTIRTEGDKVKRFITDQKNKIAFGKIKNEVFYLIKHYKPRKLYGQVLFGTGDPASTGWILGGFYALYQGFPGRIDVTPNFEEKVIEGNILIKGRIRAIHALLTAIRLFSSKHFRRMLKYRKIFNKKSEVKKNGK